jgi:tetratricopeptide (TPR) repeat protein
MRLARLFIVPLLSGLTAGSLLAQIPTRRPSQTTQSSNAPRLLVANPSSFVPQDSSVSVAVGEGIRTRMDKVTGGLYLVIPRQQMNDALKQFGYPADAILAPPVQRSFATSMQGRFLLSSTLTKAEGGRYNVTARLAGMNDDAGNTVSLNQGTGQNPADFGGAVADAFQPAVKSATDAKACIDQRTTAAPKALAAAKKALATMPKNGLAHYCMALLALDLKTKSDSLEAMKHLQEAVGGDSLSLPAWTLLAAGYEVRGDTAKTVDALKHMLLVAPTNQPLREQAFKLFLKYGHPEAAEQAAQEGLKLDPTNSDLWDLLSNARVYRGDYAGAVDALEQVIANDSAKADSSFFLKITVMASQKPDTSRLLRWASAGVKKYPNNIELQKQLLTAYSLTGQTDSLVRLTTKLMQTDSTQVPAALAAAQSLLAAKPPKLKEAMPFLDYVVKYGDQQAKDAAATLITTSALPLLQEPQDLALADTLLRRAVAVASPTSKIAPFANYYLGLTTFLEVTKTDAATEKQKSCEGARQEQAALADAEKFMTAGQSAAKPEDYAKYLDYIKKYQVRAASMVKAFCK